MRESNPPSVDHLILANAYGNWSSLYRWLNTGNTYKNLVSGNFSPLSTIPTLKDYTPPKHKPKPPVVNVVKKAKPILPKITFDSVVEKADAELLKSQGGYWSATPNPTLQAGTNMYSLTTANDATDAVEDEDPTKMTLTELKAYIKRVRLAQGLQNLIDFSMTDYRHHYYVDQTAKTRLQKRLVVAEGLYNILELKAEKQGTVVGMKRPTTTTAPSPQASADGYTYKPYTPQTPQAPTETASVEGLADAIGKPTATVGNNPRPTPDKTDDATAPAMTPTDKTTTETLSQQYINIKFSKRFSEYLEMDGTGFKSFKEYATAEQRRMIKEFLASSGADPTSFKKYTPPTPPPTQKPTPAPTQGGTKKIPTKKDLDETIGKSLPDDKGGELNGKKVKDVKFTFDDEEDGEELIDRRYIYPYYYDKVGVKTYFKPYRMVLGYKQPLTAKELRSYHQQFNFIGVANVEKKRNPYEGGAIMNSEFLRWLGGATGAYFGGTSGTIRNNVIGLLRSGVDSAMSEFDERERLDTRKRYLTESIERNRDALYNKQQQTEILKEELRDENNRLDQISGVTASPQQRAAAEILTRGLSATSDTPSELFTGVEFDEDAVADFANRALGPRARTQFSAPELPPEQAMAQRKSEGETLQQRLRRRTAFMNRQTRVPTPAVPTSAPTRVPTPAVPTIRPTRPPVAQDILKMGMTAKETVTVLVDELESQGMDPGFNPRSIANNRARDTAVARLDAHEAAGLYTTRATAEILAYQRLPMNKLKDVVASQGLSVTGDRRKRQTYLKLLGERVAPPKPVSDFAQNAADVRAQVPTRQQTIRPYRRGPVPESAPDETPVRTTKRRRGRKKEPAAPAETRYQRFKTPPPQRPGAPDYEVSAPQVFNNPLAAAQPAEVIDLTAEPAPAQSAAVLDNAFPSSMFDDLPDVIPAPPPIPEPPPLIIKSRPLTRTPDPRGTDVLLPKKAQQITRTTLRSLEDPKTARLLRELPRRELPEPSPETFGDMSATARNRAYQAHLRNAGGSNIRGVRAPRTTRRTRRELRQPLDRVGDNPQEQAALNIASVPLGIPDPRIPDTIPDKKTQPLLNRPRTTRPTRDLPRRELPEPSPEMFGDMSATARNRAYQAPNRDDGIPDISVQRTALARRAELQQRPAGPDGRLPELPPENIAFENEIIAEGDRLNAQQIQDLDESAARRELLQRNIDATDVEQMNIREQLRVEEAERAGIEVGERDPTMVEDFLSRARRATPGIASVEESLQNLYTGVALAEGATIGYHATRLAQPFIQAGYDYIFPTMVDADGNPTAPPPPPKTAGGDPPDPPDEPPDGGGGGDDDIAIGKKPRTSRRNIDVKSLRGQISGLKTEADLSQFIYDTLRETIASTMATPDIHDKYKNIPIPNKQRILATLRYLSDPITRRDASEIIYIFNDLTGMNIPDVMFQDIQGVDAVSGGVEADAMWKKITKYLLMGGERKRLTPPMERQMGIDYVMDLIRKNKTPIKERQLGIDYVLDLIRKNKKPIKERQLGIDYVMDLIRKNKTPIKERQMGIDYVMDLLRNAEPDDPPLGPTPPQQIERILGSKGGGGGLHRSIKYEEFRKRETARQRQRLLDKKEEEFEYEHQNPQKFGTSTEPIKQPASMIYTQRQQAQQDYLYNKLPTDNRPPKTTRLQDEPPLGQAPPQQIERILGGPGGGARLSPKKRPPLQPAPLNQPRDFRSMVYTQRQKTQQDYLYNKLPTDNRPPKTTRLQDEPPLGQATREQTERILGKVGDPRVYKKKRKQLNFNDLPPDLRSMIFSLRQKAMVNDKYRKIYNNAIKNISERYMKTLGDADYDKETNIARGYLDQIEEEEKKRKKKLNPEKPILVNTHNVNAQYPTAPPTGFLTHKTYKKKPLDNFKNDSGVNSRGYRTIMKEIGGSKERINSQRKYHILSKDTEFDLKETKQQYNYKRIG